MRLADRHASLLVGTLLLLFAAFLTLHPLGARLFERLDLLVYDQLLPLQAPPMSPRITVVAIDDRSIERLGRWPWDRRIHAELIERLAELGAEVIGVDILFSEAQGGDGEADERLAAAMTTAAVVLPVAPRQLAAQERIGELLPLPTLAESAAALGHVDVELDVDGLCRSVFLMGGLGDARWPSLALAMAIHSGAASPPVAGAGDGEPYRSGWVRAAHRLIPFARPTEGPRTVSYSDVLDGRVDEAAIAGN